MKQNYKVSPLRIIVTTILIFAFLFTPFETWFFRFQTPEEAIRYRMEYRNAEISSVVEYNDVAWVTRRKNKRDYYLTELVFKDKRGWIYPSQELYLPKIKIFNGYYVDITKKNKTAIDISTFKSIPTQGDIKDNINSKFKYAVINNEPTWVLALDEMPEGYTLILDGKELRLK